MADSWQQRKKQLFPARLQVLDSFPFQVYFVREIEFFSHLSNRNFLKGSRFD